MRNEISSSYSISSFLPLIIIASVIVVSTVLTLSVTAYTLDNVVRYAMAYFFLIFGFFKVINLHAFAQAYSQYDIIARQSVVYAYVYPFIELFLGVGYLVGYRPTLLNIVTLVFMTVGALGVAQALRAKTPLMCACLGAVFKLPMTWVTLTEDLLMGAMALIMLVA